MRRYAAGRDEQMDKVEFEPRFSFFQGVATRPEGSSENQQIDIYHDVALLAPCRFGRRNIHSRIGPVTNAALAVRRKSSLNSPSPANVIGKPPGSHATSERRHQSVPKIPQRQAESGTHKTAR